MRLIFAILMLTATPAFAHHEIVATASIMPFMFGVFSILVSSGLVLRRKAKKRDDQDA